MIYVIPTLKKIFRIARDILDTDFKNYGLSSDGIGGYFTREEYEKWREDVLSTPLP